MALTAAQQAQESLMRASTILVLAGDHASTDRLAAAVACGMFLEKMKKTVDVMVPGFQKESAPRFLDTKNVRSAVGPLKALHITLDVKNTPLGELSYDVKDGRLDIAVVPKERTWKPNEVVVRHGENRYDLIVALGAADQSSLGALGRDHADFVQETTVINIDCSPTNEHWGQVNLVDMNAVSVTEILFRFFEHWDRNQVDTPIATALLAGMIAATKSFRTPNVTPKTLTLASALVARGAEREKIVTSLWRTRSIPTLKLWGCVLMRLEQDRERGIVWSVLSQQDFLNSGAKPDALNDVIDELLSYAPEAKTVALLYEPAPGKGICLTLACQPPRSAAELGRAFGVTGTRERATACLTNTTLLEAQQTVIERLRDLVQPA
ncbi:MAG: hypothetical protein RL141_972 [Candidatus Parcubacteria bacterium]|jgi:phosphoesterase RecJ-like protein